MSLVLIFDTETTGLAAFKDHHTAPTQPNLAQLGCVLIDTETGKERASLDLIVYPSSWEIPQPAALVHGISTGLAKRVGVNLDSAVNVFLDLVDVADVVVAHNIAFDKIVMRRAVKMVADAVGDDYVDPFADKALFCTMRATTPIVKKRGKKPLHNADYKWPKLIECIKFFFDEELIDAHSAMADCRATARMLIHLLNEGLVELPETVEEVAE